MDNITFDSGEKITQVVMKSGTSIDSIVITTTKATYPLFGGTGGNTAQQYSFDEDCDLKWFSGGYRNDDLLENFNIHAECPSF